MKKLSWFLWLLGTVIIPLALIYFKSSEWVLVSTDTMMEYLGNYKSRLENDASSNVEFKVMFIKVIVVFVGLLTIKKLLIKDRHSGLHLHERSGDYILTIWSIIKTVVVYTILYFVATYLKINSDALFESFTVIVISVPSGIAFKLINTQLWYEFNKTNK